MSYAATFRNPQFLHSQTGARMPNKSGWQDRHVAAIRAPQNAELGIVGMIEAWARYVDYHKTRYESKIGDDHVLGPAWASVGAGIRTLLNGETGRLDCGTLDGFIHNCLTFEGFNPDLM